MDAADLQTAENALVSVIVPVYNVERFLDECLTQLVKQTYGNLEIVVVDDGSTDSSGEKCDEWERRDGRIRVIHQQNQGLSEARNSGLREARGNYVVYVDSDDSCTEELVEKLLRAIALSSCDLCLCSYDKIDTEGNVVSTRAIPVVEQGTLGDFVPMLLRDDFAPSAWAKMYTREFAEKATFEKGVLFEDTRLWARLINELDALSFCSINEPLCHYRINDSSIMGSFHAERERGILEAWGAVCDAAEHRYGSAVAPDVKFRRAWMYFEVLDRAIKYGEVENRDYCDEAIAYLRKHAADVYESDGFSSNRKATLRLLALSKPAYVVLRRFLSR